MQGATRLVRRVDPFVGASILRWSAAVGERDPEFVPVAPRGTRIDRVRWEGELRAGGGRYQLALRTDAQARLYVDGKLVLDLCANTAPDGALYFPAGYMFVPHGHRPVSTAVTLARGWHSVRLDLEATGVNNGLEWIWTTPDGVREIVPPDVLRHDPLRPAPGPRLGEIECERS